MPDIPAWTVPAAVEVVQTPDPDPAPADAAGAEASGAEAAGAEAAGAGVSCAEAAGTGELTPAVPVEVLVPQAASDRTAAMATANRGNGRLVMASSKVRDESCGASSCVYVGTTRPVSVGLSM
jgi:hypothetical protein